MSVTKLPTICSPQQSVLPCPVPGPGIPLTLSYSAVFGPRYVFGDALVVRNGGGPTNPLGGFTPSDPADPVDPRGGFEPSDPVDPTDPKGGFEPSDPFDPGDPVGGFGPADPVDPVDPTGILTGSDTRPIEVALGGATTDSVSSSFGFGKSPMANMA